MLNTTIIKLTAPKLTGLTTETAHIESQLNGLTTVTAAGTTSVPLTLDTPVTELNSERFYEALREKMLRHFRPMFLARMTTVAYRASGEEKLNMEEWLIERVMKKCKGVGGMDVGNIILEML
mgnify:CR=1 FL=1